MDFTDIDPLSGENSRKNELNKKDIRSGCILLVVYCVYILRNRRHHAYSDCGMKSIAPDASATGVNPQASQFISPLFLT